MRAIATGLALGLASMAWAAETTSAPPTAAQAQTASETAIKQLIEVTVLSTPTAAIAAFLRASRDGDAVRMTHVLDIAEGDRNVVEAYIKLAAASAGVVKAAEKQFGARDAKAYYDLELVPTESQIKEVDQATEVITGDQARVTLKSGPRAIELKRINGGWKIDAAAAFGTKAAEGEMDTIKKLTTAMNENRTQIDKGEFGSAMAAVHALQGRLLEIAEARRAESAATSAATRP